MTATARLKSLQPSARTRRDCARRERRLFVESLEPRQMLATAIYVAEQDPDDNIGGRIEVYDENLALQSTIDNALLDTGFLYDVEVGPTGDVFIGIEVNATTPGKITRFTPAGALVNSITLPNDSGGQVLSIQGFDVADDGSFWVAHPDKSGRVFHVGSTGTLLGETTVPQTAPYDVAVSSSGQVYASSGVGNELFNSIRADGNRWQARYIPGDARLLSPTNTVLDTRSPGGAITDVEEAASGNLFLTRFGTVASVLKYTAAGAPAGSINTPENAVAIAVWTTPPPPPTTAHIYVAERGPTNMGGRIEVFNNALDLIQTIDLPLFDSGVMSDIEVGPNGNLYVSFDTTPSTGTGGQLLEFTPAGTLVGSISMPPDANGTQIYPLGFDIAPDGSFRVAAPNTPNRVFHVSPTGTLIAPLTVSPATTLDAGLNANSVLVASSNAGGEVYVNARADGNFWVGRYLAGDVQLRTAGGIVQATRTFGPSTLEAEEAPNGDLYVLRNNQSGSLRRYDSAGNVIRTVNLTEIGAGMAVLNVPTTFQVTTFTPTPTGAVLDFSADLDPSTLNLYDTQGAVAAPDVTLQNSGGTNVRGSFVLDSKLRRAAFITTSGRLPPDTYTLTLRSAADGFRDATQTLLDGDANGTAGGNYASTFTVAAPPTNAVTISLPNFARGPQQPVNMPATAATGIPISFSDGGGITSASFTLNYNPALLSITGGTVAPGLSGVTVNVNTSTPGTVIVQLTSFSPLPAGTTRFVDLIASVPDTASYLAKHVLNISAISLNGGTIPALDDDAIHVVTYFGDANGSGTYTSSDASLTSRIAVGLDQGLAAHRLADPVLILDLNESGTITSADTARALQLAVGTIVPTVPPRPSIALTVSGPDPKLNIPALTASAGSNLTIPVQLDSIVDLTGSGVREANLVLFYDPTVLTINSVNLGPLLAHKDWFLSSRIDPLAGRVNISLVGGRPLEGLFVGNLVELQASIASGAPAGTTAINLAASAKSPVQYTSLNDGNLTLIPAPTDAANDPGVDGLVTILPDRPPEVASARLVDDQLLIAGTASDERIFIAPLPDGRVRVRIDARIVGDFPAPRGIALDSRSGRDHIVIAPRTPPTVIAASLDDASLVFGAGETVQLSPHDAGLLELLAAWSDQLERNAAATGLPSLRLRRLGIGN